MTFRIAASLLLAAGIGLIIVEMMSGTLILLVLGLALAAILARMTRASLLDELNELYVRAARAQGQGNHQAGEARPSRGWRENCESECHARRAGKIGGEEGVEDRLVSIEDKLDQLMAEFEAAMGGDDLGSNGDDFGPEEGGDAIEVDDTEEMMPMAEAVTLKAAPKPVTSEEGSVNKKTINADNAGAKGPIGSSVKPVAVTGGEAKGRPAPTAKDLGGTTSPKQGPATKPVTTQASGVNTKSPLAKG